MNIAKVLLIQPPCTISRFYTKEIQPPLGLGYIAAVLEKEYEVRILDAACEGWEKELPSPGGTITYGLPFDELEERIRAFNPDVVGVSCLFSMQHKNAHRVCELAKRVNPGAVTVMGGAHPTVVPELTLRDPNVDFVVIGEGEYAMRDLLQRLKTGGDVTMLDGLGFKRGNGINVNPKTKFIQDLDELPFPARHLLPMEKYFRINMPHGVSSRRSPNTPLITSRGCPANCIFCSIHSVWGRKYRARSMENIIAEMKQLKETFGVKELQFEDDNLTFDKQRALRLFERMIEEKFDFAWTTPNGVALWSIDEQVLTKMRQAGCYLVCLAIESGDQKLLSETIRKPLNLKRVEELMPVIRRLGLESVAFFVVGFPLETREQLRNTFNFAAKLNVDNVAFYLATPYPGTELYSVCEKGGFLPPDYSLSELGVKKATINPKYISARELERMIASFMLRHKLSLAWRNPGLFYRKVVRRFFKTPKQTFALLAKALQSLVRR